MRTVTEQIREHFLTETMHFVDVEEDKRPPLEEMRKLQWSEEFIKLMRVRMLQGGYRYNTTESNMKIKFKPMVYFKRLMKSFQRTGNVEFLADIANAALLAFIHYSHPNKNFHMVDDGDHYQWK